VLRFQFLSDYRKVDFGRRMAKIDLSDVDFGRIVYEKEKTRVHQCANTIGNDN
jgi:hypothetical protein